MAKEYSELYIELYILVSHSQIPVPIGAKCVGTMTTVKHTVTLVFLTEIDNENQML